MLPLIRSTFGTATQPLTPALSPFEGEGIGRQSVIYPTVSSVRTGNKSKDNYSTTNQVALCGAMLTGRFTEKSRPS
jgi:hypothetical protein